MIIDHKRAGGGPTPIVGAAYTVTRWVLSVTVECACGQSHEAMMTATSHSAPTRGACPACGATFELGGMRWDRTGPQAGSAQLAIAYGRPSLVTAN